MGKFLNGLLFGIGCGVLLAPMPGNEMRRLLGERLQGMRGSLPQGEQLAQLTQNASQKVAQTISSVKDTTQQAVSQVKQTGQNVATTFRDSVPGQGDTPALQEQPKETITTNTSEKESNLLQVIPGMEPEVLKKLEAAGISTPEQLLERTANKEERAEFAEQTGIGQNSLKTLILKADLLQLPGISADEIMLLIETGITSCKDLQQRNPEHLHLKLVEVQETYKLVPVTPDLAQVTEWIAQAMAVVGAAKR